ncbi:hypothetical protein [Longimicrobium sp.]|uniref:hypothetical protein n=1 Tax=Longimicrobium sp. TaxID=2029185 RepID=UPI003B3AC540
MRMMMIALAAILFAAPLAAQPGEPAAATDAWMRMPVPDARLRVDLTSAPAGERDATAWAARSSVQWMFIGAAVGCAAGALVMHSGADEGEKAAVAFNGCILGGSAGIFLGGVYGLLTGG